MKKGFFNKEDRALYNRALALAIPMIIQNGITNAVGLVDNLMVGSLGTESMSGVSIGGQLIFVLNLAIFGALSGPGIFCAQYYGNHDIEGVRKTFRIKIWATIFIVLLGLFFSPFPKLMLHNQDSVCTQGLHQPIFPHHIRPQLFQNPVLLS